MLIRFIAVTDSPSLSACVSILRGGRFGRKASTYATIIHMPAIVHRGSRVREKALLGAGALCVVTLLALIAAADPAGESGPTTELSCNFGMAKGQNSGSCSIAVPQGCTVANFPGSSKPWSGMSKGGNTMCQFDAKATDWKTRVVGSCNRCKTVQCSARFSVMVRCG